MSYLDKITNHIERQNKKKKIKVKFSTISILKIKSIKIIFFLKIIYKNNNKKEKGKYHVFKEKKQII